MPRKEPAKGIHTSPTSAGASNVTPPEKSDYIDMTLLETPLNKGNENQKAYKGLWTEETFKEQVNAYCRYCMETGLKPSKSSLRLWLGCSRTQYYDWETKPEKYSYKTNILAVAHDFMESSYVQRLEKYPTGNIFLLKTSHGHIEQSKIDITTNGQNLNPNEVSDTISKLGLDKPTE